MTSADRLLKIIKPFVVWFGNLHLPFVIKKITGKHYFKYVKSLEVGDILLTSTNGVGSTFLNFTSTYKHSAMYLGEMDGVPTVIESIGKGVVYTDLVTFFTTKDRLCIVRNLLLNDSLEESIRIAAKNLIGNAYDYGFSDGNKKSYCHEVCVNIIDMVKPSVELRKETIGFLFWEKAAYTPKTFLEDERYFEVLGDIHV